MIRLYAIATLMLVAFTSYTQILPSRIYKILKQESFERAEEYANAQISKYENRSKGYIKCIPYYHALGMIYMQKGDLIAAEHYYKKADSLIEVKQQVKKPQLFDLDVRDELCLVYLQGGHLNAAKELLDENAAYREKKYGAHNPFRYRSDLYYGQYYLKKDQNDSAIFHLERYVLSIRNTRFTRKTDLNRMGQAYYLLAEACLQDNDVDRALVFARRSYQINKHPWTKKSGGKNTFNKIYSANTVSRCYRLQGYLDKALKWNNKAYKLYNTNVYIGSHQKIPLLMNRGLIFWSMDSVQSAKQCFLESSELFMNYIYLNFKFMSEYEREYFYNEHKDNIDVIKSFFYHVRSSGRDTSAALAQRIFELNLNTKGILLSASNQFMQKISSSSDPEVSKTYKEWRELKNQLAYLLNAKDYLSNEKQIDGLTVQIGEKEKLLQKYLQGEDEKMMKFDALQRSIPVDSDLLEVMRVFKADTVYVQHKKDSSICLRLTEHSAYMYFILHPQSTDFEVVSMANGDQMDTKYFKGYRNDVILGSHLQSVYQAYFASLKKHFRNKEIFISADGVYHLINLNTIFDREANSYVIESYDIKPVVSSKNFSRGMIPPVSIEKVVLFGRPDFGGTSSAQGETRSIMGTTATDLPGTEQEVKNISAILTPKIQKVDVLIGDEASEENVKNVRAATILHFATHGYFSNADQTLNPMLTSGLLLSGVNDVTPAGKEDGILTAYEASLLDLKDTRIVVLSACETGLGTYKDGEGVFGLQRAFEVAGVDYIIMSLWKVNDEVTSLLMTKFYHYLSTGEDVPHAFYKAQLEIKKDYPSAKYWGAFVLLQR